MKEVKKTAEKKKVVKKTSEGKKQINRKNLITNFNISFICLLIYIVVLGIFQFVMPSTIYDYSAKLIIGFVVIFAFIYDIAKNKTNIKFNYKSPFNIGLLIFTIYSIISFFIRFNSATETFSSLYLLMNLVLGYMIINNKYNSVEKLALRKTIIFTAIIVVVDMLLKTLVWPTSFIHDSNLHLGSFDIIGAVLASIIVLLVITSLVLPMIKTKKINIQAITAIALSLMYLIMTLVDNRYLMENIYLTPFVVITSLLINFSKDVNNKK